MSSGPDVDQILSVAATLISATLLIRLRLLHLWSAPLRGFAVMLMARLLQDLILWFPEYPSRHYTILWELTSVPVLVTQALAGFSVLQSIARLYPKIG